jgi:hypothetical protein
MRRGRSTAGVCHTILQIITHRRINAQLKAWMRENKAFEDFQGLLWHEIELMANKAGNHNGSCSISIDGGNE